MSESSPEQQTARKKLSTAMAMLLFTSHRLPGVRGYELRRRLGKNYLKVVESLNHRLEPLGLRVKIMFETTENVKGEEDYDRARYFITLSDPLSLSEIVAAGWRVDDLAVLSASLAFLFSRGGKAPKSELVELLVSKLPKWRVEAALERYTRRSYLNDLGDGVLSVGWRTLAEVEQKELIKAVAGLQQTTQPVTETSPEDASSQTQ